jgi:hypothetical protein
MHLAEARRVFSAKGAIFILAWGYALRVRAIPNASAESAIHTDALSRAFSAL